MKHFRKKANRKGKTYNPAPRYTVDVHVSSSSGTRNNYNNHYKKKRR